MFDITFLIIDVLDGNETVFTTIIIPMEKNVLGNLLFN